MMDCVFCKIAGKEISTELLYEDDNVVGFNDIHPQSPVHILVIPKEHIQQFSQLENDKVLVSIRIAIQELIKQKLADKGYRIEVNGGGAQLVDHLHFHLMGPMGKPHA